MKYVEFTFTEPNAMDATKIYEDCALITEDEYKKFIEGDKNPATKAVEKLIAAFNSNLHPDEQERKLHSITQVFIPDDMGDLDDDDDSLIVSPDNDWDDDMIAFREWRKKQA